MSVSRYRVRYKKRRERLSRHLCDRHRVVNFHANMKAQLIFLATLACVLIFAEAVPTKVCEPGSVFKKDCNECKCNTDGTDMACTRKMCTGSEDGAEPVPEQKGEEQKDAETKQDEVDESEKCVPGELFKKDCNDCTCPPSGIKSAGACTLLACPGDEIQKD